MEPFKYNPVNLDRPSFRLMRLVKGLWTEIECELFEAWLDPDILIPYEALSYVWGGTDTPYKIYVNSCVMGVTSNLYSALQHLRYQDQDRILWIDAICIDQGNEKERGHQVRQMAGIYKAAEQVIVWLGPSTEQLAVIMLAIERLQSESTKYTCRGWKVSDKRWMSIWSKMELARDVGSTFRQQESLKVVVGTTLVQESMDLARNRSRMFGRLCLWI